MIEKKGWLKNAEARLDGFYINGKKEKSQRLTQAEVDAWNGVVKKKAAPKKAKKVEEPVEEVVVEEEVETDLPTEEE
jgi:hypothetical protein